MRMRLATRVGAALLVLAASVRAPCQAVANSGSAPMSILSSGGLVLASPSSSLEVVREIQDPPLGTRWLLLRDWGNPGGPGRMVLASNGQKGSRGVPARGPSETPRRMPEAAIRAGDLVVVERSTAVVEARLEAIALEPAAIGSAFHARLKIGGKVVLAVALGEGRAAFEQEAKVRR